jgi:hypothetical protein
MLREETKFVKPMAHLDARGLPDDVGELPWLEPWIHDDDTTGLEMPSHCGE